MSPHETSNKHIQILHSICGSRGKAYLDLAIGNKAWHSEVLWGGAAGDCWEDSLVLQASQRQPANSKQACQQVEKIYTSPLEFPFNLEGVDPLKFIYIYTYIHRHFVVTSYKKPPNRRILQQDT